MYADLSLCLHLIVNVNKDFASRFEVSGVRGQTEEFSPICSVQNQSFKHNASYTSNVSEITIQAFDFTTSVIELHLAPLLTTAKAAGLHITRF